MADTSSMATELVGDRELVITRVFDAPRELVWRAWTEPEQLVQWWGPNSFTTIVRQMDVRPGGVWHYCMQSSEYGDAWGKAVYREVAEPERLVYTDVFSDEEGNAAEGMPETLVTVTFEEQGGKTLLTIHGLYASAEDRAKVLEMGMEQGMAETLNRLDALLAEAS